MANIERVTEPTLQVLEVLLQAHSANKDVYGWEIKTKTRRSGPTVYGVIDRLEDAKLIEGYWDLAGKGPRRRYYRLTAKGVETARTLLAQRRGEQPGGRLPARTVRSPR